MEKSDFKKILEARIEKLKTLIEHKGDEYAQGEDNQFLNFDTGAQMDNKTPEQVLWDYMRKQLVSVKLMIESGEPQNREIIDEKIGDIICYFALLEGIMIRTSDVDFEENTNKTVTKI